MKPFPLRTCSGNPVMSEARALPGKAAPGAAQPVLVTGAAPTEADNVVLLCAGGRSVRTSEALLRMLSPDVLSGAIAAASSSSPQTTTATTPEEREGAIPDSELLHLSVGEDDADSWLLALRLVHPLAVHERPWDSLTWPAMRGVLRLADEYVMHSLLAVGDAIVRLSGRPAASFFGAVGSVLECLATAQRLGLSELQAECVDELSGQLTGVRSLDVLEELLQYCKHADLPSPVTPLVLSLYKGAVTAKAEVDKAVLQANLDKADLFSQLEIARGKVCPCCHKRHE